MKHFVKSIIVLLFLCILQVKALTAQKNNLGFYIDIAVKNNPLLNDLQNQLQSNVYDSLLYRATLKPQVNFSTLGYYAPVINQYGYDNIITNGANYNALMGAAWQPVWGKNAKAHALSFSIKEQSLFNNQKISEADLKKNITAQYIVTYGDWMQLQFHYDLHQVLGEENTILKIYSEKGNFKQTDYLNFFITYQQHGLQIQQLENQYRLDLQILNYICGITDTTTVSLNEPDIIPKEYTPLTASIFYKQFELDSIKYLNDKKINDYSYLPKLNVGSDAGYNTSFAMTPYKNFGISAGVGLTVPIYDGKQRTLRKKQIELSDMSRIGYRQFFQRQYHTQYYQLQQQLISLDALIKQANVQLNYSKGLIESYKKIITTGDVHISDYLIALNNYMNLKNNINQNIIARYQIINQLNYLSQ